MKYLLISPEKITNFLSNNPNFAFRDSLIFVCGNTVTENFINFAKNTKDEILQKAFREHPSKLIQTLLRIGKEPDAKVYLPFAILLSENRITLEDIEKIRLQPLPFTSCWLMRNSSIGVGPWMEAVLYMFSQPVIT